MCIALPATCEKGGSVNQALGYWTSTETVTNSYPLLVSWLTRCDSWLTIVVSQPMKFRLLATIVAVLASAHLARAQATSPPETDNAALRYWFALAEVREPDD